MSSEKPLKYFQAVKLMVTDRSFLKLQFSLDSFVFCHQQPTLSIVFLKVTGSLCSFSRSSLSTIQARITIACRFTNNSGIPRGEISTQATRAAAQALFSRPRCPWNAAGVSDVYVPFHHTEY